MIVIKGSHIGFELDEPAARPLPHPSGKGVIKGRVLKLPVKYGIIHDPDGQFFDKCSIYFGPYKELHRPIEMTSAAKAYMGSTYKARGVSVDVPDGSWKSLGKAVQIFYRRPGRYSGGYFHPFKTGYAPELSKNGRFYRLTLPGRCIVDDRGFVFP